MSWINDCAVWVKTTKKGDKFLSFKAERDIKAGESISIFKNDKQGNEMRPDFRAFHNDESLPQESREMMSSADTKELADSIPF